MEQLLPEDKKNALSVVRTFYQGWQEADRSKLMLHEDMFYSNGSLDASSAEEFLEMRWFCSGIKFDNIQYISDGKGTVCVRYEFGGGDEAGGIYCDIVTVEDGRISVIEAFHL